METSNKIESSTTITKKHFASINSRIQSKYEQMQKRLEKSKSVDSLTALNENFVFVQTHKVENNPDQNNQNIDENKKVPNTFKVVVEDANDTLLQDANETYYDQRYNVSYSETPNEMERNIEKLFDGQHEYYLTTSTSLESLNTLKTESTQNEESPPPPLAVPKISIRHKIGSRIATVKEKRKDKKKESREKIEKMILTNTTRQESPKILKKTKLGTVTIALIEVTGLETDTEEKPRMLCCRFRLGSEKYKSKSIKSQASPVKWQELFNINLFEENTLEISLWDKDVFLGRSNIDLSEAEREKTHKMRLDLTGGDLNMRLFILLTISGVNFDDNIALDMDEYEKQRIYKEGNRAWYQLRDDYADVGSMSVFVYGAKGLSANDCYCVVELNNDRLQTPTEFKTNDPNWMKIFTFTVTDITSILEVTVFDEKKPEVVGKISIPLLRINNGEKKWYALKDSRQRERAKGSNPRILLEMRITWNLPRASIRVINPKEEKYLDLADKLDRHLFARNLSRAKAVCSWIFDAFKVIKTCFEWESRKWNLIALAAWLVLCSIFQVWMLPLLLLVPFVWYRPEKYYLVYWRRFLIDDGTPIVEEQENEKEEKTSLRQKINSIQEMVQSVQNYIGDFASYGESIKNLYNFTVPFLSLLTIALIMVITLVMVLIPVKYIFMLWAVHKFTRKILRPNRVPNSEILDLLSRVPDDEILLSCEELPLEETSEDMVK